MFFLGCSQGGVFLVIHFCLHCLTLFESKQEHTENVYPYRQKNFYTGLLCTCPIPKKLNSKFTHRMWITGYTVAQTVN